MSNCCMPTSKKVTNMNANMTLPDRLGKHRANLGGGANPYFAAASAALGIGNSA